MKYWIGVACKAHVMKGVEGGFCQLCHGKAYPLKRMHKDDWIIYYSSKERFQDKALCQRFTAIGKVVDGEVYSFEMAEGFVPFRRNIQFQDAKEVDIRPLIGELSFIPDKKRWGYPFRFGHLEIKQQDFERIAKAMLGSVPSYSGS